MILSNDDKKWLDNKFVTKSDLKKELKKFATKENLTASNVRLGLEFDKKFGNLENKMDSRFDQLATTMDQILREVVAGLDKIEEVAGITQ